jgi:hypothetical protein
MADFNHQFARSPELRGTTLCRWGRKDLNGVFSIQTERFVEQDSTVAIRDRWWQIEKCRWRHSLAGQTVTVHDQPSPRTHGFESAPETKRWGRIEETGLYNSCGLPVAPVDYPPQCGLSNTGAASINGWSELPKMFRKHSPTY